MGHGLGPKSSLSITRTDATRATVTFPSGGRAVDVNGDGQFSNIEGSQSVGDLRFVTQNRDGIRQNVADYVKIIRVIESGVDWDEDGKRDLDADRIYALGFSLTSGVILDLFAIEPKVKAAMFAGVAAAPAPRSCR